MPACRAACPLELPGRRRRPGLGWSRAHRAPASTPSARWSTACAREPPDRRPRGAAPVGRDHAAALATSPPSARCCPTCTRYEAVRDRLRAGRAGRGPGSATALRQDRGLHDVLAALDAAGLDEQAARLLAKTLEDFRRAGVDHDDATRARLTEINERLTRLDQDFSRLDPRRRPHRPGRRPSGSPGSRRTGSTRTPPTTTAWSRSPPTTPTSSRCGCSPTTPTCAAR